MSAQYLCVYELELCDYLDKKVIMIISLLLSKDNEFYYRDNSQSPGIIVYYAKIYIYI